MSKYIGIGIGIGVGVGAIASHVVYRYADKMDENCEIPKSKSPVVKYIVNQAIGCTAYGLICGTIGLTIGLTSRAIGWIKK